MSANLKQMSIDQMATMALRDAKDNYERAADLLLSWIKRDKQLYAEFIEPIERDAAMSRIYGAVSTKRRQIMRSARPGKDDTRGITQIGIYRYLLEGGRRIGDATRGEVEGDAVIHETREATYGNRARWLRAIAKKMPEDKKVKDVFSEDQLAALAEDHGVSV